MRPIARGLAIVCSTIALFGCNTGDSKKGYMPATPPKLDPAPPRQNVPLNASLQERARKEIEKSFASSEAGLRANAIEAAQDTLGVQAGDMIMRGLSDHDPLVRFASTAAAGQVKLTAAYPRLLEMTKEGDPAIAIAVRFALHRLGDTRLSHELEKYASDPDAQIRGKLALLLGLMEEPSAVNVLKSMSNDKSPFVRWQVAEARWRLLKNAPKEELEKNTNVRDILFAGCVSQFVDDQILCTLALGSGPNDRDVRETLIGRLTYSVGSGWEEVSISAARALGMLGSDVGYHVAVRAVRSNDPRQRQMGALALGAIGRSDTQSYLEKLLGDQYQPVRLASAKAMLQLHE